MKHLKIFEGIPNRDKWLAPEEVKAGMIGVSRSDNEAYEILKIIRIGDLSDKEYHSFRTESDGWVPNREDLQRFENDRGKVIDCDDEYFVLVRKYADIKEYGDDTPKYVFFYGSDQIAVPVEQRWKGSNKLDQTNQKAGVFERLKSFKKFDH